MAGNQMTNRNSVDPETCPLNDCDGTTRQSVSNIFVEVGKLLKIFFEQFLDFLTERRARGATSQVTTT